MTEAIRVENLSKQYRLGALKHETMLRDVIVNALRMRRRRRDVNTILALDDVSFSVEEGEVVGIVGRNGAGKSTLLKILSRITYPTAGRVRVRGRVASLIEVGTGFHDELTGRENIYLNGSILGMRKREIEERFSKIVDFAGVEKFIDTPIKRYSSGMRLRLGFAVAAHMDPDVLFVDEVLAVGDAEFQKRCLNAMDDLRSGGRTVLFVSHNMSAIESLCPRTIWVDAGKLREDGPSGEVIHSYLTTFAEASGDGHDLTQIAGRGGNGAARYTRIEFMDAEGNPVTVFRTGEPLRARLHFQVHEAVKDPRFALRVFSDMGALIATISSYVAGCTIAGMQPGSGYIDLVIPSLPLLPRRYYVSLWLVMPGQPYDILDHCLALDVDVPTSGVHKGRGMHSRWGLIWVPSEWRVNMPGA
ncbi:MAG: ABC transporter ATP-binding protein [Candidatus Krumholzibacteria bacterium]|nr:ABC transporter ATP-binding protein [Candidatus Krumholzibacteria bacterium]